MRIKMRVTVTLAAVLFCYQQLSSQTPVGLGKTKPSSTVFASLPAAAANTNVVYLVTDCLTAACSVGGGSLRAWMVSNGSAWGLVNGASSNGGTCVPASTAGKILVDDGATGCTSAAPTISGSAITASLVGNADTATALAANPTDCASNLFANAIAASGNLTCAALTLAGAQFANQGTTTTVLHGNAAGNPSFGTVSLVNDIAGTLGVANGGTGRTTLGTGVATALGLAVSGTGAICLDSGSACSGGGGADPLFLTLGLSVNAVNPTLSGDNAERYAAVIGGTFDPSNFGLSFPSVSSLRVPCDSIKGDNDIDGVNKTTLACLGLIGNFKAQGQHILETKVLNSFGMGDAFMLGQYMHQWGGVSDNGAEGTGFWTAQLSQGGGSDGDGIAEATISSVGTPSTCNTTITQTVTRSTTAQAVTVASSTGCTTGNYLTIDGGTFFGTDGKIEGVQLTAGGGGTITAVFRHDHSSGATVKPSIILNVDTTQNMGQMRYLVNRTTGAYTTGTVTNISNLTVTGSGTTWVTSTGPVGGNATIPGCISFADDDENSAPFGSGAGQLHSWYGVQSVASNTSLVLAHKSASGSTPYSGKFTNPSNYIFARCARILDVQASVLILENNSFTWTAADVVEAAISVDGSVDGLFTRLEWYTPGSQLYAGATIRNFGARTWSNGIKIDQTMSNASTADTTGFTNGINIDAVTDTALYITGKTNTAAIRIDDLVSGTVGMIRFESGPRIETNSGLARLYLSQTTASHEVQVDSGAVLINGNFNVTGTCTPCGGAPVNATYITQTANGTLSNEQALGSLGTGIMASTTTTGVVATRTLTGTANQITVTNGDGSGNPTFSIPTNPTLPGTTTGTFSGNIAGNVTGAVTGNVTGNITGNATGLLYSPSATKTTTYTLTAADELILCNGTYTNTLEASPTTNQTHTIKYIASGGTCTISGNGKNIDHFGTSTTITVQDQSLTLKYDGTQWWLI